MSIFPKKIPEIGGYPGSFRGLNNKLRGLFDPLRLGQVKIETRKEQQFKNSRSHLICYPVLDNNSKEHFSKKQSRPTPTRRDERNKRACVRRALGLPTFRRNGKINDRHPDVFVAVPSPHTHNRLFLGRKTLGNTHNYAYTRSYTHS